MSLTLTFKTGVDTFLVILLFSRSSKNRLIAFEAVVFVCLFFYLLHSVCYPGLVHSEAIILLDELSATLRYCVCQFSLLSVFFFILVRLESESIRRNFK